MADTSDNGAHNAALPAPDRPQTAPIVPRRPPMNPARSTQPTSPRVKGKLYAAIDLMIFEGKPLDEAANGAGLTTYTLRQAFGRPAVIEHVKRRRDVFRAAINTRNILRLAQIRDAADNMPAVNAIKELEANEQAAIAQQSEQQSPGITIVIAAAPAAGQGNDRRLVTIEPEQGFTGADSIKTLSEKDT
jgi:hypothetical protein